MAKSLFNQFSQIRGSRTYEDQLPLTVSGVQVAELAGHSKELNLYVDVSGTTVTRTSGTFEKRDLGNVILIGGSAYGITAADGTAACTVSSAPGDGSARPAALMYYENLEDDLNYIRTMLKEITGLTNWYDPPTVALSELTFNFIELVDVFIGGHSYTANNMLYTVSSGVKDTSLVTFDPNTQMFTAANITTGGTLDVDGAADFDSTLNVQGGTVLQSSLTVGSDAVFQNNVTVSGTFQFDASGQAVSSIVTTMGPSSTDSQIPTAEAVYEYVYQVGQGVNEFLELIDTPNSYTANNFYFAGVSGVLDTNKVTYTPGTDAFRVGANSMTVTGTADFTSTLDVSGNATFDTDVRVDGTFKFDAAGQAVDNIVTSISEPGLDANLATEQAIVEYVTAVSGVLNGKLDAQDTFIELDDTPDDYHNTKLVYSRGSDIAYADNLAYDGAGLVVSGTLNTTGAVTFDSSLDVDGATTLNTTLDVDGATTLNSSLDVDGTTLLHSTLETVGVATFDNNVIVSGTTTIYGATTINDTLHVTEGADFDTTINVDGAATFNNNLEVFGDSDFNNATVSGNFNFDTGATVNVIETTMDPAGGDDTTLLTESAIWDWVNTVSGVLQSSTAAQTFLALTDTDTTAYTAGNMFYSNAGETGIADTANMNYDSTTQSILFTVNSGVAGSAFTVVEGDQSDPIIDYSDQGGVYTLSLGAPAIDISADGTLVNGFTSLDLVGGSSAIRMSEILQVFIDEVGASAPIAAITVSGLGVLDNHAYVSLEKGVSVNNIINVITGEGALLEWSETLPTVQAILDYVNPDGSFNDVGKFITLADAPHDYIDTKLVYSTDDSIEFAANLSYNGSTFVVSVPSTFTGNVTVSGTLYADGALDVDGAATLNSTLDVDGATTLNNTLDVDGATTLNNTLDVDGATTLNSSLDLDGTAVFHSTLAVTSGVSFDSTLDVDGITTLNSSLDVDGATTLNSSLDVDGAAQFNNNVSISGTFGFDTGTTVTEIATVMAPTGDDNTLLTEKAIYDFVNSVSGSLQSDVIWEVVDTPYLQIRPKGAHMGKAIYTSGDVTIGGNLTVTGTTTTVSTEQLTVEDNMITINAGEAGNGVTAVYAGIEIDRGTDAFYQFIFDENADNFRVGVSGVMTPGNTYALQAVCTREDSPIDMKVPWWDASDFIYRNTGETYITINSGTNTVSIVADTNTKMEVAVDNVKLYGDGNDYVEINSSATPFFKVALDGNTEFDVTSSGMALDYGARVDDITIVITEPGDDMTLATEKAIVDYVTAVSGVLASQTSSQTFLALTDTNDATYNDGQVLRYVDDGVEGTSLITVFPQASYTTATGVQIGYMSTPFAPNAQMLLSIDSGVSMFNVMSNAFSINTASVNTEQLIQADIGDLKLAAGIENIVLYSAAGDKSVIVKINNTSTDVDELTINSDGITLSTGASVDNIVTSISQPGSDDNLATEQAIVEYVVAASGVLQYNIDHVNFIDLDDVFIAPGVYAANDTLYVTSSGIKQTSEVTFNPSAHTFSISLGGGTPLGYFSTTNQYVGNSDGTKVNLDQTGKATTILVNNNTEVTVNANGLSLLTGASVNDISTVMQPTGDDDTLLTEKAIYDWVNTVSGALAQSTSSQTFIALTDTPAGYENTKLVFSTASSIDYADNLLYDGAGLVVSGTLRVSGAVDCDSTLNVDAGADFQSTIDVDGAATLNNTLDVDGATTLNSTLDVDGATTLNSSLDVDGTSLFHSTVEVVGAATFENNVTVSGTFKFDAAGQAVDNIVTSISDPGSNSNLPTEAAVFTHVDTVSGVLQSEINALGAVTFYDVNMTYVSSTQWTYGTGLTTTPELQVYVNGLKQRNHADYYTAAVVSGVLTVDFAFTTYSEDWVNATYRK